MVLVQSLFLLAAAQSGSTAVDWRWDRESSGCGLLQAINSRGDIIGLGGTPGNAYTAVTIKDRVGGKIPAKTLSGGLLSFVVGLTGCRGTGLDLSAAAINCAVTRNASLGLTDCVTLGENDELDGGTVLPGLRISIRDWFERALRVSRPDA